VQQGGPLSILAVHIETRIFSDQISQLPRVSPDHRSPHDDQRKK